MYLVLRVNRVMRLFAPPLIYCSFFHVPSGQMRRTLSIVFTLFFAIGPLTAVFGATDEARLPACCRRSGTHHCSMSDDAGPRTISGRTEPGHFITAPSHCPLYPHGTPAPSSHALASPLVGALLFSVQRHSSASTSIDVAGRIALRLSVRGPPHAALS